MKVLKFYSMNNSWQVGNVKITQIIELEECEGLQEGIPEATPEEILKISWLKPNFINDKGEFKSQIGCFVIESKGLYILVDTGIGNDKFRADYPFWTNLKTNFLEKLEQAGFSPSKIDFVISSHLHLDHVGWNTILVEDKWMPTFPNSRYLVVEKDFNYWRQFPEKELEADKESFKDSVLPVYERGLVDLISDDYAITSEVRLFPTPGHTPGSVSFLISSKEQEALLTGDTIHHPCQLVHPEWETNFDTDKEKSKTSRKALLERFADTNTLIIGSHFASPTAGYVKRDGKAYKFTLKP